MKTCLKLELAFPVTLYQHGPENFRVVYGKQVKDGLTYAEAARELGECIMHALACDSRLDNSDIELDGMGNPLDGGPL